MRIYYEEGTGHIVMTSDGIDHIDSIHIEYPYIDISSPIRINEWKVNVITLNLESIPVEPVTNYRIATALR